MTEPAARDGGRRINLSSPTPAAPPPPQPTEGADDFDIGAIFAQLLARKWTILLITLLGLLASAFWMQLPPNEYQARSVAQIEQRSSGVALPEELIGELLAGETGDSTLETEFHIIKSRLILDPVVEELGLDIRVIPARAPVVGDLLLRRPVPVLESLLPDRYVRAGESITIGRLVISREEIGTEFSLLVTGPDSFRISAEDGAAVEGRIGETVTLGNALEIEVAAIDAPEGRVFGLIRDPLRAASQRISRNLSVGARRDSEVVDFRYVGDDPEASVAIVNAVIQSYRTQNLNRRSAEIDQSIAFIEQQLPEVRTRLEEAVAALDAYQQDRQSEELSVNTSALVEQAVRLESSLRDMEFRESLLLENLTPDHPDVVSLRSGKAQIEARLRSVRAELAAVPDAERDLADLTTNVERERELEAQLTDRISQLRILKASTLANIRVLETAEVAELVGPSRLRPVILGGLLAFLAASGLVLLLNRMSRGIEDARAIDECGLSLFASVGLLRNLRNVRAGHPDYSIAQSQPKSLVSESLRGLRTGLQFSLSVAGSRCLMITSCAPGDGKSFISLNLALVSAETGSRVLLVDCDMRRGELAKHFGRTRADAGLSDLLAGKASFGEVLHKDEESGLEFIGTGSYPPNPSELLMTQRFSQLFDDLQDHYDLIILDAPPVLAVTDPGIIGQTAGLSLLVVRHLVTAKPEIEAAKRTMATAGVNLSGVVLNQFDMKRSSYGYYGSKYGYYGTAYSYKYD